MKTMRKFLVIVAGLFLVTACSTYDPKTGEYGMPIHNTGGGTFKVDANVRAPIIEKQLAAIRDEVRKLRIQQSAVSAPVVKKPLAVKKTKSVKKKVDMTLVSIGGGNFCPADSVKGERIRIWAVPGGHAFTGGTELGIKFIMAPKEVKSVWLKGLKDKSLQERRNLKEGEASCQMAYTVDGEKGPVHRLWPNVRVDDWVNKPDVYKIGATRISATYRGYVWVLTIPDVCGNVNFVVRKIGSVG